MATQNVSPKPCIHYASPPMVRLKGKWWKGIPLSLGGRLQSTFPGDPCSGQHCTSWCQCLALPRPSTNFCKWEIHPHKRTLLHPKNCSNTGLNLARVLACLTVCRQGLTGSTLKVPAGPQKYVSTRGRFFNTGASNAS